MAKDASVSSHSELGFFLEFDQAYQERSYPLRFVGESQREFLFLDIYNIAYYQAQESLVKVQLLEIVYQRDLSKEKLRKASKGFVERVSKKYH